MLSKTLSLGTIFLSVVLSAAAVARGDQPPGTTNFDDVRVKSIASDRLAVDVVVLPQMTPQHFLGSLEARTIVYLPDVDTTTLASFGLGHGAYLTKKAVGNLGDT